jgi:hypothetical protein
VIVPLMLPTTSALTSRATMSKHVTAQQAMMRLIHCPFMAYSPRFGQIVT